MPKKVIILEAAMQVFSKKGFYQAKIEEIAETAGVGKGTVYEYFASKKVLFEEVFLKIYNTYLKNFRRVIENEKHFSDKIYSIIYNHVKFSLEHLNMAMIIMMHHHVLGEKTLQWFLKQKDYILKEIENVISGGIHTGEISQCDSKVVSQIILGSMTEISTGLVFNDKDVNIEKVSQQVTGTLFYGILKKRKH